MRHTMNTPIELEHHAYEAIEPIEAGNVAAVVGEIRGADRAKLIDESWLATYLLPRLGLNDEWQEHFPSALHRFCGKGIKSWQYPCQFAGYLTGLAGKNITSYLEIGVRHGGTFIITCEYLRRFTRMERLVAIDPFESPLMAAYQALEPQVECVTSLSHDPAGRAAIESQVWDHVLVDGDHSLEGCETDFQLVKNRAKRIALHDIVSFTTPGVVATWDAIKKVTPSQRIFERTRQYVEIAAKVGRPLMGIGVVELA